MIQNLKYAYLTLLLGTVYCAAAQTQEISTFKSAGNPIIKDKYTADPAALVYRDSVYLYTGHDQAPKGKERYEMHEWLCYSSADMVNWKAHKVPLSAKDFLWAKDDAWASQVIERDGKFYWFVSISHNTIHGKAIGVAVSDSPTGPFKDAIGKALITNDMTTETTISWDDIDPTVIIDDDGQAYLFWGNTKCYYAKLKKNMIELDGPIKTVDIPEFTEAPWVHKRKGWYYLSYASQFPEKIVYAMSKNINGPWTYKGILNEIAGNSNTNHQAIIDFKGKSYFIYHNGSINNDGGSFRRSVCIDYLYYHKDGSMKRVVMTTEGVGKAK
ncbi:Glycosyl hydrolases family 43 [Pedobacter sp. ok626]|nr:Glycosyl hydrolases family 43 [Pedobacter sp. ok626]